jgi:16S rRNA (uracil1498-N3)-methyltransferase
MHRFFLPEAKPQDALLKLSGGEAHHALQVLRMRPGDRLVVLDGAGRSFICEALRAQRDQLEVRVLETQTHAPPPCRVTLLQAIPKGKLMESIVQKATELGAARVVPLLTERTVVQLDDREADHKADKWQTVAIEAVKQCGSAWLPKVEKPVALKAYLSRNEACDLSLLGSLQGDGRHPREWFEAFRREHHHSPLTACAWVGPEGDFTPLELDQIRAAGALPITLGPLVLRAETAAIYCLSILNYELGSHSPPPVQP